MLGVRLRRGAVTLSFLAPALLGIGMFFVYPLISAVYFSFTKFDLLTVPQWVGLDNYRRMAGDPFLLQAVRNTLWMVAVFVPVRMLFTLGMAMMIAQFKRGAGFYRTLFYLPSLVPPVAATIAFVYLLKPGTGPVNHVLSMVGIDGPLWFNSPAWAKPSLVLLGLWACGDLLIIFLAAVLGVPESLYEAASLDGANAWHRFRSITLPTIRPVLLFAAVTGVIYTLQYFDQAAVAGSIASGQATVGAGISQSFGYPEGSTFTYPLWLFTVGFRYSALGYANALAIALFVVALAITVVLLRRAKAFSGEES
ncbi:sugar ABC transporter permease [Actinoplanes sp. SE50]|uniref:carbohydrate ABC transporter permease n=1 Tax=unclassified Actinoplanes TaxID=2626549 RepID=UPI00023EC420|nr:MULTISPECIES: sugar ABC transporter permease [unclassified Actinoplanes]AEV83050.1 sn-glycerol-3-phosphate transport system permease protein ugpA [Actinoplanes sp. SE50/110]ATO81446.1 sugar ABC transporter permease [Actinoplanes sp. SE50]SLL98853.1 sugar ABC transporter permease [Actinoplanes sp. SE50/110]